MRHLSFALTTPQFLARSKTVTRRNGWTRIQICEQLQAVEKGQGLKKGETVRRLGVIEVVDAHRERIRRMTDDPEYGRQEVIAEGFPELTPEAFVAMYCAHNGCTENDYVTRIEFRYVD